jgi:hypothetical protein
MADLVARLRSNEPLPVCPFDRLSPHYWTMPDDKPCPICGQENTLEGPDKCRGADTRVMREAADEIEKLRAALTKIASLEVTGGAAANLAAKTVWREHISQVRQGAANGMD